MAIGHVGTAILAAAIVLAAWAFMAWDWATGRTITFAVAGILPISDAAGYFGCASSLVDLGHFAPAYAGWCGHRPIYLGLLSALLALGGRYLQLALLAQAALIGVSLAVLAREALRFAGAAGTALALAVLWAFAAKTCFLTTTTESAGLAFGALALALLLAGAGRGSGRLVLGGIALMSIALNARAGALFVLPLLVLWSGVFARQAGLGIWRMMAGAVVAVAFGFVFEYALVAAGGNGAGAAHSDFAYTLYGLAAGGKSWTQAAADHPEIAALPTDGARAGATYRFAVDLIRAHPWWLAGALARNFVTNLMDTATFGIGTRFGQGARWAPVALVAALPWLVGVVAALIGMRDRRKLLLATLVLGGLLSGPIIVQDGGIRVFAATIAGDCTVAGLGVATVLRLIVRRSAPADPVEISSAAGWAGTIAAVLLILVVLPFTPAGEAAALPPLATGGTEGCATGEQAVLARPGRDSPLLVVPATGDVRLWPPRVPAGRFARGFDQDFWFAPAFRQAPPASYLLAYQRAGDGADRGSVRVLVWPGDLTGFFGQAVRLCVTSGNGSSVAGLAVDRVASVARWENSGRTP
jgi:hypothetical protein